MHVKNGLEMQNNWILKMQLKITINDGKPEINLDLKK